MKAIRFFILGICLILWGCGSTGKHVSVNDYPGVKPLGYDVTIKIIDPANLFDKGPIVPMDIENTKAIWTDILKENSSLFRSSGKPKYTFTIEPLYTLKTGYIRYGGLGPNVDYHGFAMFRLIVHDSAGKTVHDKLFKIYGMWNTIGTGSIKGPAEMGYYSPTNAITRLGLLDIISYICQENFLTKDSVGIENISHLLPDMQFRLKPSHVIQYDSFRKDYVTYSEFGCAVAYFKFLMGEKGLNSTAWQEGSDEILMIVAKLAAQNKWPLFPKELDVSKVPYSFKTSVWNF